MTEKIITEKEIIEELQKKRFELFELITMIRNPKTKEKSLKLAEKILAEWKWS
jgi:hypothetical protein